MRDIVSYALPLWPLGELAQLSFVRRDLDAIFAFRQQAVAGMLA
jgi:hypothetical protein